MKFSIIIATCNRSDVILRCLNSIKDQSFKNFEIIIIDQSDNDDTKNICLNYKINNIIYKKINKKGLSLSRNIAIKISKGEYLCFLDDDAEYTTDVLEKAKNVFEKNPNYVGIMGKIVDKYNKKSLLKFMDSDKDIKIPFDNYGKVASSSLILKREYVINVGMFDEEFGSGTFFGACEDNDIIYKISYINNEIYFIRDIIIYHPCTAEYVINYKKVYSYNLGYGALCKKHYIKYNNKEILKSFIYENIKLIIHMIVFIILLKKKKFLKNYYRIKGNIIGYIKYKN